MPSTLTSQTSLRETTITIMKNMLLLHNQSHLPHILIGKTSYVMMVLLKFHCLLITRTFYSRQMGTNNGSIIFMAMKTILSKHLTLTYYYPNNHYNFASIGHPMNLCVTNGGRFTIFRRRSLPISICKHQALKFMTVCMSNEGTHG